MRSKINPEWKKERIKELDENRRIDRTSSYLPTIQWLIKELVSREMAFTLINLGAGVKRITTDTEICPKCNGTGRC